MHADFYTHQNSGACGGICMCDPTNQIEKTGQDAQAIAYTHAITCVIKKK